MRQDLVLNWKENMCFSSIMDGHEIVVDAAEEFGGTNKGPRPKKLLLLSLAGCTAMDVVSLLKKMRVEFSNFKIVIDADLSEDHPKRFNSITLIYIVHCSMVFKESIEKAVKLSEEKYCGVNAMFRSFATVEHEIIYL